MEQSILTLEVQRWANAIVKLTSLTYANKLVWVKRFLGAEGTSAEYNAELEGQRFQLTVSSLDPTGAALRSSLSGVRSSLSGMPGYGPKSTIFLRVFDRYGSRIIDIPNLSVLQPLADAVQSQADSREESVLSAIEKAGV